MDDFVSAQRCEFTKGDIIDGKYTIDSSLGEGSFGHVYRVTAADGSVYALKLLKLWTVLPQERSGMMRRFNMEYETGMIPSKHLVHSLGHGEVGNNPYILMEYCSGGDLSQAVEERRVDLKNAAVQILLGLKDLHSCGKVHRDLKPENVLLRSNGAVVLTDFGISGDRNNRMTARGIGGAPKQMFGTFGYMPPEQVNPRRGNSTVLPTTDIFSFGVMMYQLLTGTLPFGRLSEPKDLPLYIENGKKGKWDKHPVENLSEGWMWLKAITGCLEPDFRKRFQSADEVLSIFLQNGYSMEDIQHIPSSITSPQPKAGNGVQLRIMQGEEAGMVYKFDSLLSMNGNILTLGRLNDEVQNSIQIREEDSSYISRCHCTFEKDLNEGNWLIRDGQWRIDCPIGLASKQTNPCLRCSEHCLSRKPFSWKNSMNGTFVNSSEVGQEGMVLMIGDIITVGDVKMRVEEYCI